MSGISPGPLLNQPAPPWRVALGNNAADSVGRVGASFFHGTVGATPIALILPAANVSGVILRSYFNINGLSTNNPKLFADTAAPSGYADFTRRAIAQFGQAAPLHPNIFVPVGYGLWVVANGAGYDCGITWDVL